MNKIIEVEINRETPELLDTIRTYIAEKDTNPNILITPSCDDSQMTETEEKKKVIDS